MIPADAGGTMTPYGKPRASGDDPVKPDKSKSGEK